MAINDIICDTESVQCFPNYTFEIVPPNTMQEDEYLEGEYEQNEVAGQIIDAFKECLEEIVDSKGKELVRKFISNGDMKIPLARFVREAVGESRANDILGKIMQKVGKKMKAQNEDFVYNDRGVSIDEELKEKLERFKVKTVNFGGVVVKEEQK